MPDSLIQDVSDTAFLVAMYRAMESRRADALFHDPLAEKLAGEHGEKIIASLPRMARIRAWMMAIRTRIIDDFIQQAIAEGVDTVLNLGAGLDTRPYRMNTLGSTVRWIEVDYPHVIDLKDTRLADEQPLFPLERVKLDLAEVDARREFLRRTASKSKNMLVLTEGVVPYLSVDETASLADDLRALSALRYWIVDYFSPDVLRLRRREDMKSMKNAPFRFRPADYFEFFRQHGWKPKDIRYIHEEGARLNRPIPLPAFVKLWLALRSRFTRRAQRDARNKFAAYVLFEPEVSGS